MRRPFLTPGIIFGVAILVTGTVLLLKNFGLLQVDLGHLWLPILLAGFGLSQLLQARSAAGGFWGGLLLAAGVYIGLENLGYVDAPFRKIAFPLFLMGVGGLLLWRALQRSAPRPGDTASALNEVVVFGGANRRIVAQDFRGGELYAAFGGHEIDLLGAAPAGDGAVIDANVMFGGIEIKVPSDWSVNIQGIPIFGGFEDSTVQPKLEGQTPSKRLTVRGFAIFGGVEVKN
ncbi:MAG: hypothetical protein HY013_05875 [Candidatus Solibacter usitatus]|nr:hypothetical protein [Candidatus Solibacter usitatus]